MKTSYIQAFDKKSDAITALASISGKFPNDKHALIDSSNQVQIWTTVKGERKSNIIGAPDDEVVYLVLSTPG